MTEFNIEEYLNSLPDDVESIDVSHKNLTYLPDLSRFKNLEVLSCINNELTSLPILPETLLMLNCSRNKLTSFPVLNMQLIYLNCSNNQLTLFPVVLPQKLKYFGCSNNQLTSLPYLNNELYIIDYENNPIYEIIYNKKIKKISVINKNIETWNNFRYLYYCLKYKKRFLKLMEAIIKKRYHPSYLNNLTEDDDLDEILNKW